MKNAIKLFGIIALAIIISFTVVACDPGDGDNGNGNGNDSSNGGMPNGTLAEKLAWLQTNAQSNTSYVLEVNADESIPYLYNNVTNLTVLYYPGKSNISITLKGIGAERVITSPYALIVNDDITLILENNITIQGTIDVHIGGELIMQYGTKIANSYGVRIYGGTFTMNGGEISDNLSTNGGGVNVDGGTFTMNAGKISGNTAAVFGSGTGSGGGVYVSSGHTSLSGSEKNDGNGTFTMNGGEISGNSALYGYGGGVCVSDGGVFSISNGTIYGSNALPSSLANTARYGAAVYTGNGVISSQYGTFSGNTFTPNGNIYGSVSTIQVVNGVLIE